jgi:hypothetical protein
MNVNHSLNSHWGTYDVIVVGGGITGVAAAWTLRSKGIKVALIEQTGTLGREIVRGRSMFVDLPSYLEHSPSVASFYARLSTRQGWFNGILDTNCAAIAFDDILHECGVDVFFHTWPSKLQLVGTKVQGIEVASKSGYGYLEATYIVDASVSAKLSRPLFNEVPGDEPLAAIHLLYNGIEGDCPENTTVTLADFGDVRLAFRPTFWPGEWRVTLYAERHLARQDCPLLIEAALEPLHAHAPALVNGVLAYVSEDNWEVPSFRLATGSKETQIVGGVANPQEPKHPVAIHSSSLSNPDIVDGLMLAGFWIEGYPVDLFNEETMIINAFRLGEIAGHRISEAFRTELLEHK